MSKFARPVATRIARTRTQITDTATHEGGEGFSRPPKDELFLLAVTNMVGERTFYEDAKSRDDRFEALIHDVMREDPAWIAAFVPVLRDELHMRSASLVMAALYAHERLGLIGTDAPSARSVVASALQRADEPAEMLAFWLGRFGRAIPKPVKRGVADAARRLYTERNALKWDSDAGTVRMGDAIELAHVTPVGPWQSALFRYLIDDRHNRERPGLRDEETYESVGLATIAARRQLEAVPVEARRGLLGDPAFEAEYAKAGGTWEWLSGWIQSAMDKVAWERAIPEMGYMALLRNLRNFDKAKISDESVATVKAKLADPAEVAKSRQLPLRFYSASKAADAGTWRSTLETAVTHALANVPTLPGRTLVMVDVSGSMEGPMSDRSKANRWELAALFGCAFALRNEGKVYAYSSRGYAGDGLVEVAVKARESVLMAVDSIAQFVGGGTETWQMTKRAFDADTYERIIILTDEQAFAGGQHDDIPADVPIYTFNLAGYRAGHAPSGQDAKRFTFGGLTDAGFEAIRAIELGVEGIDRLSQTA